MKILVLNGSPKRDKSDTMHITRAFIDGMNEAAENEIKTINAIDKDIEYCTGCFACMSNGGDCIHRDDIGRNTRQRSAYLELSALLLRYACAAQGAA